MKRTIKTFNRYFTAILYKDDIKFDDYFNRIYYLYSDVTYIVHDRDFTELGELKKSHMHIVFKVGDNPRSVISISEEIGLPIQYIEGCNHDNMLLYLLHFNQPNKTQYCLNDIRGDKSRLEILLEKKKDNNLRFLELLDYINSTNCNNLMSLFKYACSTNKVDVLLRGQLLFNNLIKDNKIRIDKNL